MLCLFANRSNQCPAAWISIRMADPKQYILSNSERNKNSQQRKSHTNNKSTRPNLNGKQTTKTSHTWMRKKLLDETKKHLQWASYDVCCIRKIKQWNDLTKRTTTSSWIFLLFFFIRILITFTLRLFRNLLQVFVKNYLEENLYAFTMRLLFSRCSVWVIGWTEWQRHCNNSTFSI